MVTAKKKYNVAISMVALGALSLSACAVDPEPAGTGSLNILCTLQPDVCESWTKSFAENTGIKTDFLQLTGSGEALARIGVSQDSPEFDAWVGGNVDGYGVARERGLLEPYVPENSVDIPSEYMDQEGYWSGVYIGALGFCSNQVLLEELGIPAPTKWDDLLDERLRKQVSVAHPATSGGAFNALWTQAVRLGSEDAAIEWSKKLHPNVLQYSKSGTATGQLAGRGEVTIGVSYAHDCVLYQEQGMTDIVITFPEDGTGFEIGGAAIIKGTRNLEEAQQWMEFMTSAEAQALRVEAGSYQVPTNRKASLDPRMVSLDDLSLIDFDLAKATERKPELTARFDAEVAAAPKD